MGKEGVAEGVLDCMVKSPERLNGLTQSRDELVRRGVLLLHPGLYRTRSIDAFTDSNKNFDKFCKIYID